MISEYCVDLQVPVPHPLKDPSVLNQTDYKPDIWFGDPANVNQDYIEWLDTLGLVLTSPPLIFYTPARRECGFHIDGDAICDRVVMNWIVGGEGSQMHWYTLAPDAVITAMEVTQAGTPYTRYNEDQLVHLHSQAVKWPSIVQVGTPHKITNYVDHPRWCLSCDIGRKDNPEAGLTMEEAKEIFKTWIV